MKSFAADKEVEEKFTSVAIKFSKYFIMILLWNTLPTICSAGQGGRNSYKQLQSLIIQALNSFFPANCFQIWTMPFHDTLHAHCTQSWYVPAMLSLLVQ